MSGTDPYRIVLADDHTLLRQGVRKILEGQCDLEVLGEACDGIELLNFLKMCQLSPNMVIRNESSDPDNAQEPRIR
jgi:DNA-binding NarL/FixJ family response regulator